ncbi:hypothetical protein BDEG_27076 [Batrachochytrium dendrobatidis JEL423]|uniref:Centrosomin N-terminal motif 1 domain-containing protein n=1 Tax=Batrachochytrium dendrobatidis (strain JEL423) TaxID=403673 RepID=A0A177WUG3_BATDL|nr:hypothetical protein BDEG_27076 [Batrachochytrium dendrobatidis JEL423]
MNTTVNMQDVNQVEWYHLDLDDNSNLLMSQNEYDRFRLELLQEDSDAQYTDTEDEFVRYPSYAATPIHTVVSAPPTSPFTHSTTTASIASTSSVITTINPTFNTISNTAIDSNPSTFIQPKLSTPRLNTDGHVKVLLPSPTIHSTSSKESLHLETDDVMLRDTMDDDNLEHYSMGLKLREKLIDDLKKENFGLKMRCYFLTENLEKLSPEGLKEIINEHAELKAIMEDMRLEERILGQQKTHLHKSVPTAITCDAACDPIAEIIELHTQKEIKDTVEQLESMLTAKTEETDIAVSKLNQLTQEISIIETKHAKDRLQWEAKTEKLNQKLTLVRAKINQERETHIQTVKQLESIQQHSSLQQPTPTSTSDESKREARYVTENEELKSQVILYKQKVDEYQAISACNADDMVFLQNELERQTAKVRELEEKFHMEAEQAKNKKRAPELSKHRLQLQELSNETLRLLPQSTSELSEANIRNLLLQLYARIQTLVATKQDTTKITQTVDKLVRALPLNDSQDANRLRYITELKQRNLLLVQVNQRFDSILADSHLSPQAIKSFSDLKVAIHEKLELLKTHYESLQQLNIEKRLWKTKMSAMEVKLARANHGENHNEPDVQDNQSNNGQVYTTSENEVLKKQIKELQAKLERARQNVRTERQSAQRRVEEFTATNRQLENELLQCSKTIVALKGGHNLGEANPTFMNSPTKAKLARLNDQLRTDLGDQIADGSAMREQLRRAKVQYARTVADHESLKSILLQNEISVVNALSKLASVQDRHMSDPVVIKQVADQVRHILKSLRFK